MSSGIYRIVNKVNGNEYVGLSNDIDRRWVDHKRELNQDKHGNQHLQTAWNNFGAGAFRFEIIEENVPVEELELKEKEYIRKYEPEYNISHNENCRLPVEIVSKMDVELHPIFEFNHHDNRPDWHAWVYGGARNPQISGSRRKKAYE